MVMIVTTELLFIIDRYLKAFLGELLEKATRVLTDEEKKVLEQDWVGKDGSKRKLEVCRFIVRQIQQLLIIDK